MTSIKEEELKKESYKLSEEITDKQFPQNELQEYIYNFWKIRGWDEVRAVLGNLDVTFHQPQRFSILGISYNYLEQFWKEGKKQGIQEERERTDKIIDEMPEYLLMTEKGEYGISKKELKQTLQEKK